MNFNDFKNNTLCQTVYNGYMHARIDDRYLNPINFIKQKGNNEVDGFSIITIICSFYPDDMMLQNSELHGVGYIDFISSSFSESLTSISCHPVMNWYSTISIGASISTRSTSLRASIRIKN